MAVVTITITDDEVGGCSISASSVPEISDDDSEATPSQLAGAMVMRVMDAMVQHASVIGGDGE